MESFFVKLFLHALLHCCKRPVMRRIAILGPLLHNGLYCMAWTVLALILGLCRCWWAGVEVICTWRLGMSSVARVCCSVKSGAHGRCWPTQAQLMRSEIFETSMSRAGSVFGVLNRYLREEGESACLCLVSALVIQPVLLCSVLRRFVHATGCGKHLL